jgi:site-specific recombinase XerD
MRAPGRIDVMNSAADGRGRSAVAVLAGFGYATGLRASESVGVKRGDVRTDTQGDRWIHLVGKGKKAGKVVLPPLARSALDRYLIERELPISPECWQPAIPLVSSLSADDA